MKLTVIFSYLIIITILLFYNQFSNKKRVKLVHLSALQRPLNTPVPPLKWKVLTTDLEVVSNTETVWSLLPTQIWSTETQWLQIFSNNKLYRQSIATF